MFFEGPTRGRRTASPQYMESITTEMVCEACDRILSKNRKLKTARLMPASTFRLLAQTPLGAAAFRRRLLAWYDRHARDLPWRRRRDPYAVWLSEIMLQQTQVATVEAYFERFLRPFPRSRPWPRPTSTRCCGCGKGWAITAAHGNCTRRPGSSSRSTAASSPAIRQVVRRLPGIGRYTAGAILSIAFDAREPILEANTLRLLEPAAGLRRRPASAAGQRLLWAMAEAVLPRRDAGRFNQALMELGSEVCTAADAAVRRLPGGRAVPGEPAGPAAEIPPPKAKRPHRAGPRGGRAGPPPRPRAVAPLARRPPLGRPVGFSPFPAPEPIACRDPPRTGRKRPRPDRRRPSRPAAASQTLPTA